MPPTRLFRDTGGDGAPERRGADQGEGNSLAGGGSGGERAAVVAAKDSRKHGLRLPAYARDLARLRTAGRCTWEVTIGVGQHGWELAQAAERGEVLVVPDLSEVPGLDFRCVRGSAVRIEAPGVEWGPELALLVRRVAEHAAPVWLDGIDLLNLEFGARHEGCSAALGSSLEADYRRREESWDLAHERACQVLRCA